jgi:hypothetical protein
MLWIWIHLLIKDNTLLEGGKGVIYTSTKAQGIYLSKVLVEYTARRIHTI